MDRIAPFEVSPRLTRANKPLRARETIAASRWNTLFSVGFY
ncbi:hypothetical protein [Cyclobacterium xiamenense]|nr:hypothetical protein [Cyclobacterium xiamenense]